MDLDRLLKLRLVVARHGEMDVAQWWDTKGLLGPRGAQVLRRGFPRTHLFAQARIAFEVARSRCDEVFSMPGSMTLWNLPADAAERFEEQWPVWVDSAESWQPFFDRLAECQGPDVRGSLQGLGLLSPADAQRVSELPLSAEGRAVVVPGIGQPTDAALTLLAAAFGHGGFGRLAVPYARLEE